MTKIFITFGGGGQNFIDAGERLVKQIARTKLFDEEILYTDEYLKKDEYFWNKHGEFIENNKRGYGHWLWKPYITKITMDKMKDGDILFYLDSGCEFEFKKKDVLQQFFEYVKSDLLIGTATDLAECQWTKMDLLAHFGACDEYFSRSYQRQGGTNLFLVCDKTRDFVNKWYETCCNYHLIDDSPSIIPNHPWFRDHRHDQSVYSILFKKYNFCYNHSLYECIRCNRNKSGISEIENDE
jgi:hypothetical protein